MLNIVNPKIHVVHLVKKKKWDKQTEMWDKRAALGFPRKP